MPLRVPKGSYFRNSADYFYKDLAIAVTAAGSTPAGFPQCALYNNDGQGNSLFVVGLSDHCGFGSTTNARVRVTFGQGVPPGAQGSPPQNIWLGEFQPSGQVFFVNDAAGPTGTVLALLPSGDVGCITTPGWPLFIVPPNFFLQFTGETNNTFVEITAWYIVQVA